MKLPELKKISQRERIILMVGAGVLFLIGGYYFAVSPWLDYRAKLKKEIRVLERTTKTQHLLLTRATSIAQERSLYNQYIHVGETSEIELAGFLKEIESLASQTRVSLQEIRPLKTVSGEWFQEYGLEVNFVATLPEWIRFVYAIEHSQTLFTVEKVRMEKENEDSKTLTGSMQIKKTVVLNEPLQLEEEE